MFSDFSDLTAQVRKLDAALARLCHGAHAAGVPSPEGDDWFELLKRKVLPQMVEDPWLVVAVIGGTNIGKSAIFNLLAGETASAVSPHAAGTKHPVCLVPSGQDDPTFLGRLFEGFALHAWRSAEQPLAASEEDLLFWRVGQNVPPRLLLLDSPDIDSDARINWRRARFLRQSSDLLIAVLTQQKYNDAAVKQFFREAADADKPVIVLFNQCDPEGDAAHWPIWLETFLEETGCRPELVAVLPWDRKAANDGTLAVYDAGRDGRADPPAAISLREHLASLQFDHLKVRALRGALRRIIDQRDGVGGFQSRVREAAERFAGAGAVLSASDMVRVEWPTLPMQILVDEIRQWWDQARRPWTRGVHGVYRAIGRGVLWPIQYAWQKLREDQADPIDQFHVQERRTIVTAVEKLFDELERLAEVGNETLRPRLLSLLGGHAREKLLRDIRRAHEELPAVDEDYRQFLRKELDAWGEGNPGSLRFLRALDQVGAVARPAITVTLAVSGFVFAEDLLGQAAAHMVSNAATEAAIAGGITGSGEAVVSSAGVGIRQGAARLFARLQRQYAQRRAQWLADWLEHELLGDLLDELRRGASLPVSDEFQTVDAAVRRIQTALDLA